MELMEKLRILSDAAKYDASCSSSGSKRRGNGLGVATNSGICHSFTEDGRCVALLKILMTNYCIYDCKYCTNRRSNNRDRAIFLPEEIANLTINFYKRNYIEGLFLSSGVIKNPDYTMEKLIETITLLRNKYHFHGYIHCKTIPGASKELIHKLGLLSDRMSINIELPSNDSLKLLAPDKKSDNIFSSMKQINDTKKMNTAEKKKSLFVPAGQSTQLIVGATNDTDYKILTLTEGLYNKFNLKRVYYSAYVPVNIDKNLPMLEKPPLLRENRLYQADWLLRFYGFKSEELLDENNQNFNSLLDPKLDYALRNLENYPIEINKADYLTLLRIPGIGVNSAKRIISTRKYGKLDFNLLKKIGVVLKRAKYFITCNGKYYESARAFERNTIQRALLYPNHIEQLELFKEGI